MALSSGALALLGHDHVVDAATEVGVGDDQAVVRGFVESNLTSADLESGSLAPDRLAIVQPRLGDLVRQHGYQDVALFDRRQGSVLAAASEGGSPVAIAAGTRDAASAGRASAQMIRGRRGDQPSTLVEAIPVVQGTEVRLVFQISRPAAPILARAGEAFRDVVIVTLSAAVVLAMLLYAIFRAANIRLGRQEAQIAETSPARSAHWAPEPQCRGCRR